MEIYNAIMKAADHIERNPHSYNFFNSVVPECGTQGCMLGWIGHFMGMTGANVFREVGPRLGFGRDFLAGAAIGVQHGEDLKDSTDAVRMLRRFAQRYHPLRTGLPDSVREIFTVKEGA